MIIVIPLAVFAVILAFVIAWATAKAKGYQEGVASAQIDPATRLVAAGVAEQILAMEFAAAERGRPFTIVLFSLDNYRRFAGEAAERLLLSCGAILRRRTRGMHISARLEDGLFISILGGVEAHGALTFAHRVRKDFATLNVASQPVLLSISICEYRAGMQNVSDLLAAAQGTLAEARAKGGTHVLVAGEEVFESQTDVVFLR